MLTDFYCNKGETSSLNATIHGINTIPKQIQITYIFLGIPMSTEIFFEIQSYNPIEQKSLAKNQITSLNTQQLEAFRKNFSSIVDTIDSYFFIDRSGSKWKTYLYCALLHYIWRKGDGAISFATAGIAATLLNG